MRTPNPESYNAVVAQRIEINPGLIILRVVPRGWELPPFEPGQYAVLGLLPDPLGAKEDRDHGPQRMIKRAYSIASSPEERDAVEFYIALVPDGALTPRLFGLHPGDEVWLSPKIKGTFTLDSVPPGKNVILIATGTGLAPFMSILRSRLAKGEKREFVVLHGARHSWDLGYREELQTMERLSPNFTYIPMITRPGEEAVPWTGERGHVQELWSEDEIERLAGFRPDPESTHVFLCGNPAMIEETKELLSQEGFREHTRRSPGELHVEKYW